jgi:hypothetical protein
MSDCKNKKKQCFFCKKKIKFIEQIECKCGEYFCNVHRHFQSHNCSFNYKEESKEKLTLGLGGGEFSKIDRI